MNKVLVSDIEKYLDGTYDWDENPDNVDFDFTLPEEKKEEKFLIHLDNDGIVYKHDFGFSLVLENENKEEIKKNNTVLFLLDSPARRLFNFSISGRYLDCNRDFNLFLYDDNKQLLYNNKFFIKDKHDEVYSHFYVGDTVIYFRNIGLHLVDFCDKDLIRENNGKKATFVIEEVS